MERLNIRDIKLDETTTKQIIGRNGIHYEYIIPLSSDPRKYYKNAVDVRSRKRFTSKWKNGKKPGQYQPIGDKSYFNFYQLKHSDRRVNIINIKFEVI